MLGINPWQTLIKPLLATILAILFVFSPIAVPWALARPNRAGRSESPKAAAKLSGKISETSPPSVIQELRQELDEYQPQVTILSPKPNEILLDNQVTVRFQVSDLPLFKDETLGLGPHLHVFLDNQPYQAVYNLSQPLVLENLEPGTHSLRVFASRPWHESFKNEGAYAQTRFHVLTKTDSNTPDPNLPLLTYSRPQGSYGAEPIMLDFYLTNAPLHLVAQEDTKDDIADWRIRCTVNGDSFVLDRWQAVYLKGFKPGKNWVQLEFLDDKGNPVKNEFNNTVRLITYEPNGKDTLSKLVRGDLSAAKARGIVDPTYQAPPEVPVPVPTPEPTPAVESPEAPAIAPPLPAEPVPLEQPSVTVPDQLAAPAKPESVEEEPTDAEAVEPSQSQPSVEIVEPASKPKSGFFDRFRPGRGKVAPSPSPATGGTQPPQDTPEPPASVQPELVPSPEPTEVPELNQPVEEVPVPELTAEPAPTAVPDALTSEPTQPVEVPAAPPAAVKPVTPTGSERIKQLFSRLRRPTPVPSSSPSEPVETKLEESPLPALEAPVQPKEVIPVPDGIEEVGG